MSKHDDIAISVKNVSKTFKLPNERISSVKSMFVNPFRRRTFERQKVLDNISFDIKKGEFFGIVGRNGSGKSTLLKMLAGIYAPDKGSITLQGKLVPFIELGVGFNQELSGRENVFLNGALLGFTRKQMEAMYDEIVEFAELGGHMDVKLKNYSSGMQVRLAFSIAIRTNSDILLIDEVLAVGDANFQKKCFDYFAQVKAKGQTVVFVSHDAKSVERFCDRVLLIDKSRVIDSGRPEEMMLRYSAIMASQEFRRGESSKKKSKHLGTQELSFTDLKVAGTKDELGIVHEKSAIQITIQYKSTIDIPTGIFNVALFDHEGCRVASFNTNKAKLRPSIKKGEGSLILTIKDNPLVPGVYSINVGFFADDYQFAYDHVRNIAEFAVIGGDVTTTEGKVRLDAEWGSMINGQLGKK